MTRLSIFLVLALGMVAVAFQPRTADASVEWGWDDPVVSIGGQTVSINIGVQGEAREIRKNVDAAIVEIHIPEGVPASVVLVTNRYFKEKVRFVRNGDHWRRGQPIRVQIVVTFDADARMPAQVKTVYPGGTETAFGHTMGQIVERITLK